MTASKIRIILGLSAFLIAIIFNEWTLLIFSPDGTFGALTRIGIWIFDIIFISIGLLFFFANRNTIMNLALFFIVIMISAVPIDLILRSAIRGKLYYRPEGIYKNRWPSLPSLYRYEKNVHYEDLNCGDLAVISGNHDARQFRHVTFITDKYGFRNADYDSTQTLDLIMLGDSFGAAVGTDQEKSWCSILHSAYGFRTYNLSIDGTGPWQEYMNLKIELPRLHIRPGTKVLWTIYTGNDIENPQGHDPDSYRLRDWFEQKTVLISSFLKRSPFKLIMDRIITGFNPDSSSYKVVERNFLDNKKVLFSLLFDDAQKRNYEQVIGHKDFPIYQAVFDSMRVLAQSNRLDLFVVIIPTKEEVYGWLLNDKPPWSSSREPSAFSAITQELSQMNGFSFYDLKPALIDSSRQLYLENGDLLWWYDDIHWNEIGNRVAASLVYNDVLRISGAEGSHKSGQREF